MGGVWGVEVVSGRGVGGRGGEWEGCGGIGGEWEGVWG